MGTVSPGLIVVVLTAGVTGGLSAQHGASGTAWPYYGGDAGSTRYAPLDQINRDNVNDLEVAWRWTAQNFGPRPEFNYRTTPVLAGGVLYATAGARRAAVAIDAATGETLWVYRMDEGERGESAPRPNSGRGVAYWTDGASQRILVITPAYHLVALDADNGRPIPTFGADGVVDLKTQLGRKVDRIHAPIGSSSPPLVVGDILIVGSAFPSGGAPPTKEMPPGYVRGYDARTGRLVWTFHTIPQPGELGHDTWRDDSWRYTGNAGVWTAMSADLELGLVYLPVEAGTGDYYGGHRPGDNLFSQSLVCLDAMTGERVWHYQLVHHGIWDYDPPAPPILADLVVDGTPVKAVVQVTKQGFAFVFDRVTGEPVWPIEERPVAPSDVPGERTSPTQPFPTKPPPFERQGITSDDLLDLTPELKAEAVRIASQYRTGPLFTPPSLDQGDGTQGTLFLPGPVGGANWQGGAVDPETGMLYVSSTTIVGVVALDSDPDFSNMRFVAVNGPLFSDGGGPQGLPLVKPPWGRITAIDLNRGEHVWMIPNGDAPEYVENHPALAGIQFPRTGRPDRGGLLVTKTLLFAGEGGGLFASYGGGGRMLRAHDKQTGEILAEFELPANQTGLPMTYEVAGRQYIVVAVGGKGHPGELVALSVP